jgi:thioredoxin 1
MNLTSYEKIIQDKDALVVDFWAPWCGPCKMIATSLAKLEKEYQGRVNVIRINVDDSPDLARSLQIYAIPTLMIYRKGKRVLKKTGAMGLDQMTRLFDASLQDQTPVTEGISVFDRVLRVVAGLSVLGIAAFSGYPLLLIVLGAGILFLAVYDRCPIWKAITHKLHKPTNHITE